MNEVMQTRVTAIETAHTEFLSSVKNSLEKAIFVGEQLVEAKDSVGHGEFTEWVEENLSFGVRTAQKYMRIFNKQDVIEEKGAKMITEAYDSVKNPREPENYHKRYKTAEDLLPDDLEDDEEEVNFVPPVPEGAPNVDKAIYKYWPTMQKAIRALHWVYSQLAPKRDGKTPYALGYMIGNIDEMADRIEAWNPENLKDCEECLGSGWVKQQDENGVLTDLACPYCIGGKTGPFKITDK